MLHGFVSGHEKENGVVNVGQCIKNEKGTS